MKKISVPRLRALNKGERSSSGGIKLFIRRYWFIFLLIGIFAVSLWFRLLPSRFNELIGLDEFHVYRIAEYALKHNLQIPNAENLDMMRYSPYGVNTWEVDYALPSYLPVFLYLFVSAIGISMSFFEFAIIIPAYMGAVGCIIAFFIGKELFKSNVSGLFVAFFVSMTPSLFTRTSGASFEKEATAVIFMFLAVWLFLKAYNKSSLGYGIVSGVSLALMSIAWGGVQYIYLVFAAFLLAIFLGNVALVILDYLFSGFKKPLENLEKFLGLSMLKAYGPFVLIGTTIQLLTPHNNGYTSLGSLLSYFVLFVLAIRYSAIKFGFVKKEYVHYIIPGFMLAAIVIFLGGSMFTDFFDSLWGGFSGLLTLAKGDIGSTVAENAPADWGTIISTLGAGFAANVVPQMGFLSPWFALWIFMILGTFLIVYEFYKTQNWMLLLPIVWLISSIWGVFYMVRLLFILGPAAGICAGFFFGWCAQKVRSLKFMKVKGSTKPKTLTYTAIILLVGILIFVNVANTYAYSVSMTPAICFAMYNNNNPLDVTPCVTIDQNGNQVLHTDGQPWYQAMDFLATQTPQDSVVLSWWDFGYWFQTRGNRTSVADGGNLGGKYLRNYELADWYTDDSKNWDKWVPWMEEHNVTHIFMDYTLIGKYGAITTIASRGKNALGFLEFKRAGIYPKDNATIVEYTSASGPYAIWLPLDSNGGLAGAPSFLVMQDGKYYQKSPVNDVCTVNGIIRAGNASDAMPGCIALSDLGVFYIPKEAENTIFVDLMFMKGYGLPVEKVFDNTYMQIYKVKYDYQMSVG